MNSVDVVIPCYEVGSKIRGVLEALAAQRGATRMSLQTILVDDGSTPEGTIPDDVVSETVGIRRHAVNRGRAAACNTGAHAGSGELVWFLDADCVLVSLTALEAHLAVIAGHDVSVGPVCGRQAGFWGAYQNRISNSRVDRLRRSLDIGACTSANLMVRRDAFETADGFNEQYTQYGFEDRDFFERARNKGLTIGFAEAAMAFHDADLNLADVCRKMRAAGRGSSGLFRSSYPGPYHRTAYGKLDARDRGAVFRSCVRALSPFLACASHAKRILEVSWIPFPVRAAAVKALSGIAYAAGTLDAMGDARTQKRRAG